MISYLRPRLILMRTPSRLLPSLLASTALLVGDLCLGSSVHTSGYDRSGDLVNGDFSTDSGFQPDTTVSYPIQTGSFDQERKRVPSGGAAGAFNSTATEVGL